MSIHIDKLTPACIEDTNGRCIHPLHQHPEAEVARLSEVLIYNKRRGRYFKAIGRGMTDRRDEAFRFTREVAEAHINTLDSEHLILVPA